GILDSRPRSDLKILRKIAAYVVQSGGKRIRPLFLYYLGKAYGAPGKELIQLGALLEIVHAASLLHDDVIDKADERRNQPTGAKLFGNKQVILGGDHLLSSGLKYLNGLGNADYMAVFTDAIQALSEAELLQMQQHFDLKTPLKVHARVVDGKTAVLFRAAGALTAIQNQQKDYYRSEPAVLGESFGRYFQHRDDCLDYFDAARLKKKGLQDFANGIVTRPLAYLLAAATRGEYAFIRNEWEFARANGRVRSEGDILQLLKKHRIEERCLAELRDAETRILAGLAALPQKEPAAMITREFQKILAVRAA
ncbi:MAG: polyprenyl synthetase family protein, partial [Spirochaetes bacterium]|nr:polyprenyl synthetase family protein [Spirochaetota bacterium]